MVWHIAIDGMGNGNGVIVSILFIALLTRHESSLSFANAQIQIPGYTTPRNALLLLTTPTHPLHPALSVHIGRERALSKLNHTQCRPQARDGSSGSQVRRNTTTTRFLQREKSKREVGGEGCSAPSSKPHPHPRQPHRRHNRHRHPGCIRNHCGGFGQYTRVLVVV